MFENGCYRSKWSAAASARLRAQVTAREVQLAAASLAHFRRLAAYSSFYQVKTSGRTLISFPLVNFFYSVSAFTHIYRAMKKRVVGGGVKEIGDRPKVVPINNKIYFSRYVFWLVVRKNRSYS